MTALGRILQAVGWAWFALGFLGGFINLPFDLNIFPGIVLIFISRIIRAQGARTTPDEGGEAEELEDEVQPRILNTERARPRPRAPEKAIPTAPEKARSETPEPTPEAKRQEMLEQILVTGTDLAARSAAPETDAMETDAMETEEVPGPAGPMSSAEMIAQARKRWNKRP